MKEETTMVQTFVSEKFGEVRTVIIDGEPYFVGKDVATALGYKDTDKAIRDHVDDEDKMTYPAKIAGQVRHVTVINESGLYSLILTSTLPKAKEFKHWVTAEVLPAIRKTGEYKKNTATPNDNFTVKEKVDYLLKFTQISPSNEQKIHLVNQAAKLLGVDVPNCSTETFGTVGTKRTYKHKLSDEQIAAIRETYSQGNISLRKIAEMYNVGLGTIHRAINDDYPF